LARLRQAVEPLKRAFREFLALPAAIIAAFVLLAWVTNALDRTLTGGSSVVRAFLSRHIFSDASATSGLLDSIAGGIISVTSITITLLLLVVQQTASTLGAEVFDQFLRRRQNQAYFGFFIGLALFALVTLATVNDPFNPVFGGAVTLLGTCVGLFLLLVLFHTTINQMRPVTIVNAIHDRTLEARRRQLSLVARTRRSPRLAAPATAPVVLEATGFVTAIHLGQLEAALAEATGTAEVVLDVSIGTFVAFRDQIATVRAESRQQADALGKVVADAISVARQRDLDSDPAYGIEQLASIAWTSMSSAKQNPAPGQLTIYQLRDLLARWSVAAAAPTEPEPEPLPVVYHDNTLERLFDAVESLVVVASQSLQHQNLSAILGAVAVLFNRLPPAYRPRAEALVRRTLSTLDEHVLTAELEQSLAGLDRSLREANRDAAAEAVAEAAAL
jgi:uncharacterized membrane protein